MKTMLLSGSRRPALFGHFLTAPGLPHNWDVLLTDTHKGSCVIGFAGYVRLLPASAKQDARRRIVPAHELNVGR